MFSENEIEKYPRVSVVFFCHDGNGNHLMHWRNANARDENECWDIGAGGIDFGESVEDTLKREIKEEYCTDVLDFEFLGFREIYREHKSDKTHWVALDFKVLVDKDSAGIGEPDKFDKLGWFTLKNLPKPIHSQLPHFFEKYRERLES